MENFCYWLQGFFELSGTTGPGFLTDEQIQMIKNHLALVFKHDIDPKAGNAEVQKELNKTHNQSTFISDRDNLYRC